ncbi:hypothetical protein J6Z48_00175 [bacterium]|nr:hypothetical protein [bacterium]
MTEQTLQVLIAITVIATLVSVARYFTGTKSYGIYVPIVLSIAYSYTGLRYGLVITSIVILVSTLSNSLLKKIRMHYLSRIAINYCFLSIVLILAIAVINKYGFGLDRISTIDPLALVSIVALSDFLTKQIVQKSFKAVFTTLLGTILIAAIGWFIITRKFVTIFIINNPWLIFVFILINLIMGRYKGLRFNELLRFKSVEQNKADDSSVK